MDLAVLEAFIAELERKIEAITDQIAALVSEREEYERARDANRVLVRRLESVDHVIVTSRPTPGPAVREPKPLPAAATKRRARRHVKQKGLLEAFQAVMEQSGGEPLYVADIYQRIAATGVTSEAKEPATVMHEYGKRLRERGVPIEPVSDRPRTWRWVGHSPKEAVEQ